MEHRKDSASQRPFQVPSGSSGTKPTKPNISESTISGSAWQPLNYSIQTGEEFALEFMRERANSRMFSIPNTSGGLIAGTGPMEQKGKRSVSDASSESGSDVSMSWRQTEKGVSTETRNESSYPSKSLTTRALSDDISSQESHRNTSSMLFPSSSAKLKFLCSFGGKILPRPRDGKLRYVGGETRILQISKGITLQELMEKTTVMYNQCHTIKYELPGEDLHSLVSVSSDEDVQMMIEECSVMESTNESQKPRMFLFSSDDNNDMHLSLGSIEQDTEIQYVAAVNCVEGSAESSSTQHGLVNTSATDLEQLFSLSVEVDETKTRRAVVESVDGNIASMRTSYSPLLGDSSGDCDGHLQQQAHTLNYSEGNQYLHSTIQPSGTSQIESYQTFIPSSTRSDYDCNKNFVCVGEKSNPKQCHELQPPRWEVTKGLQGGIQTQDQELSTEPKPTIDFLDQQKNKSEEIRSLENKFSASVLLHPGSVSNYIQAEVSDGASSPESAASVQHFTNHLKTEQVSSPLDVITAGHIGVSEKDDHHHRSAGSSSPGFSYREDNIPDLGNRDPSLYPLSVFRTKRIPREQAELQNRLSKSDDSFDFQHMILRTRSNMTHESIAESIDTLHKETLVLQSKRPSLSPKPAHLNPTTIQDSLETSRFVPKPVSGSTLLTELNRRDPEETSVIQVTPTTYVQTEARTDEQICKKSDKSGRKIQKSDQSYTEFCLDGDETAGTKDRIGHDSDRNRNCESSTAINEAFKARGHGAEAAELKHPSAGVTTIRQLKGPDSILPELYSKGVTDTVSHSDESTKNGPTYMWIESYAGVVDTIVEPHQKNHQIDCGEERQQKKSGSSEKDPNPLLLNIIPSQSSQNQLTDRGGDNLQVENLVSIVEENLRTLVSEYEESKPEMAEAGGTVINDSVGDLDLSKLQIIKNEDLEELRELGSGTYGTVYHGKWRGTDVAIKRIKNSYYRARSSQPDKLTKEFWREAHILSKLHHPNVVAFYGVVNDGPGGTLATVTEFMVNGSLKHVLLRNNKYLDRRKRLIIALDAAIGMEYLHSKGIIHFDLKCDNLLVNLKDPSRPICKVTDFGLSKIKRSTMVSGGMRGTLPWMAPEILTVNNNNKVSDKVDVYSFGIVMWEILTGEEPYADMHHYAVMGGILSNTLRPPVPPSCDPEWKKLMEQCWARDPLQRPSFTEIASHLLSMLKAAQTRAVN